MLRLRGSVGAASEAILEARGILSEARVPVHPGKQEEIARGMTMRTLTLI